MIHRPSIVYANTSDNLELPVIDVTHPDFAIPDDPASRAALVEQYNTATANDLKGPAFLRRIFMKLGARRSQLLRALIEPSSSFLGGLTTYLMKLGADHLPDGFNAPLDRRIAGSPHARFVRLRMQHCATMLADGLELLLIASADAPLHLLNIGGGPSIDSLNALLILAKRNRSLLSRRIHIHVCDLDDKGPHFGASALAALQKSEAPLTGFNVSFDLHRYDWNKAGTLEPLLASFEPGAIIAASSEGALFEYGTDEAIVANLRALHSRVKLIVGSVTSDQPIRREQIRTMHFALYPRGIEGFQPLATEAGYIIDRAETTPLSDQVSLVPQLLGSGTAQGAIG
jgi:hypothetical protein